MAGMIASLSECPEMAAADGIESCDVAIGAAGVCADAAALKATTMKRKRCMVSRKVYRGGRLAIVLPGWA